MRTYITAFMLAVTLGLVSCGGGNDGASTGSPVVAQATVWSPTANGGCGSFRNSMGLTPPQQCACNNALNNATVTQCTALGGAWQTNWYCSTSNATNPQKEQCLGGGVWFSSPAYCAGSPSPGGPLFCY